MSKGKKNNTGRNLLIVGGVALGGFFLWQLWKGFAGASGGAGGTFDLMSYLERWGLEPGVEERDEVPIIAPSGITWPQAGFPKPPIYPQTTYTKSPVENFGAFIDEAAALAKRTGIPTYVAKGGYYVTEEQQYIKGAGW